MSDDIPGRPWWELSRRQLFKLGALAGAGASVGALGRAGVSGVAATGVARGFMDPGPSSVVEATVSGLQKLMREGKLTSRELVDIYLERIDEIDRGGPHLNSVLQTNPEARAIAEALDEERRQKGPRGPLHGIPVLLKDNIDTHDRMQTAAGSLALVGTPALQDSTVAARLRKAGAVILGKTNLSEWANFRSSFSSSGWSGRGGQCNNPYVLDHNPCGSSSGSGAAVSANLTAVSIGTETDGSIVCPAHVNGVVGIKPTVGLVSRAGVVPISHTQDTIGPHTRTIADAAAVLGALVGVDSRDPATSDSAGHFHTDYTQFLDPNGLAGARIGVARQFEGKSPHADVVFEAALTTMRSAGATLVDVTFQHFDEINAGAPEFTVLLFDFHKDLNAYLATRTGVPIHTLADAIAFNNAHADRELRFFGQDIFLSAQAVDISDPPTIAAYNAAVARDKLIGGAEGIDQILQQDNVSAIVAPTGSPSWPTDLVNGDHFVLGSSSPAAITGYPIVQMPAGFSFGLPVGISFMGTAWSEPTLIRIASGFEHARHARRPPSFLESLRFDGSDEPDPHERDSKAARPAAVPASV